MGKKNKKHLQVVTFDEETVTKENANQLLSKSQQKSEIAGDKGNEKQANINKTLKVTNSENEVSVPKNRRKKRNKEEVNNVSDTKNRTLLSEKKIKRKNESHVEQTNLSTEVVENVNNNSEETEEKVSKKRKKSKTEVSETAEELKTEETGEEISVENPKVKTVESIRAQKRKKYQKLLEEKRLKVELANQQNALNYLSKWKHCPSEWKFEKLKQIWLQQHLFDTSKVPNEFWEITVEYFNGSKGSIRNTILKNALKIIEKEDNSQEENTDEDYLLILQRARDIVQNLQE